MAMPPRIMSPPRPAAPAAAAQSTFTVSPERVQPSVRLCSISVPLPHIIHTTLHIQVTRLEISNMVFLTTNDPSNSSALSALGSFVYAMPNRFRPAEPLCTSLYAVTGTVDFATRMAKIVARRTAKPAYVGCSAVFPAADVEEETGALRTAIDAVMGVLGTDEGKVNGI